MHWLWLCRKSWKGCLRMRYTRRTEGGLKEGLIVGFGRYYIKTRSAASLWMLHPPHHYHRHYHQYSTKRTPTIAHRNVHHCATGPPQLCPHFPSAEVFLQFMLWQGQVYLYIDPDWWSHCFTSIVVWVGEISPVRFVLSIIFSHGRCL